jgi:hypothetical protein
LAAVCKVLNQQAGRGVQRTFRQRAWNPVFASERARYLKFSALSGRLTGIHAA